MSKEKIEIHVEIAVSVKEGWNYLTEAHHIQNWYFAIPEWHCPRAENDVTMDGRFSYRMEAKDGSFGFDFAGVYTEVEPLKGFSYRLEDDRMVIVSLEEVGTGIRLTEIFEPEDQNPIDLQREGWLSILKNFKAYAESQG